MKKSILLNFAFMKKFRAFFLLAFLMTAAQFPAKATHIVGGDITVRSLGGNNFEVKLILFFDCYNGLPGALDQTVTLGVYDLATNVKLTNLAMPLTYSVTVPLGDSCFTPTNVCIREQRYIATINLPNNANGYYLSWHRCCRNGIINNIVTPGASGNVFYVEVPNPSIANSSPTFSNYPDAYMCVNTANKDTFASTDIDGDSLVYSFTPPYDCAATGICGPSGAGTGPGSPAPLPQPKPYGLVTWQSPYTSFNFMGDAAQAINSNGIISTTPPTQGVFVFCVQVDEYRNGVRIGRVRRDVQYNVLNCNIPTASVVGPNPICLGQSTTIGASGGVSYQWSTGATSPSIVVTPTAAGTYTYSVTVSKNSNCTGTSTATITVKPMPVVTAAGASTVCAGTASQLTASGATTYVWSPSTGLNNANISNPVATPNTSITYNVTGTTNGCSSSSSVAVQIKPSPSITANTASICQGESAQLTASGADTYSWAPSTGLSNPNISNPVASPNGTTTYTVSGTANGCTGTGFSVVQVNPKPVVVASSSGLACSGGSAQLTATGANSYVWSPSTGLSSTNISNPVASPGANTTYMVIGNLNGCLDTAISVVLVGVSPTAGFTSTQNLTCAGITTDFMDVSTGANTWSWNFGDGTTSTDQNPPTHTFAYNGSYNITLIASNPPCSDTMSTSIIVGDISSLLSLQAPNVFTPNGDGLNDCFKPVISASGAVIDSLDCFELEVFDRWGVKIFESKGGILCWDGKTKSGTIATDGTYYYIIKFGQAIFKGNTTLLKVGK